jgi:hypothetical protein
MTIGSPLQLVQNLLTVVGIVPFDPSQYPNFPYAEYMTNKRIYTTLWNWYSGNSLEVVVEQQGKKVDKYPVKINPFRNIVHKHTAALIGEIRDDDRPVIVPKATAKDRKDETKKKMAKYVEDQLTTLWNENNGRAIQVENGSISQIYGGCVFKITYVPWETWREIPLRIERILPEQFFAYPDLSDPWRLSEAWIVSEINNATSEDYGIKLEPDEKAFMMEYWSKTRHWIQINGRTATKLFGTDRHEFDEENPYGFVPVVYIPHIRVGKFWGESVITNVIGLVEELNLRMADYGDAISDDSHKYTAMRNVNGSPTIVKLSNGLNVINLGSSQTGLTGQGDQPDIFEVNKGSASQPMSDLTEKLFSQIRRDSFTPPIADGEDEGSQRSSLTLNVRFWPLTSHINIERVNWGVGLNLLHWMALKMMATNDLAGITDDHVKSVKLRCGWNPVLPKDREELITEVTNRSAQSLGSPQHLLEMLGDVEDPEEEMKLILAWLEEKAKLQALAQPAFGGPGAGGGGAGQPTKQPPKPSSGSK